MLRTGCRFRRVEARRRARAFCSACWLGCLGLTAGALPSTRGIARPAGCSICCRGPPGMPTGSAMTCAAMSPSAWAARTGCWWSTRDWRRQEGHCHGGVQRQYTGTAGKVENAQVAVCLTYSRPVGHALIDRELYLPESWTADPGRCAAVGIPESTAFATKPELALRMVGRARDAGTPAGWVTGDEVYGNDPGYVPPLKTAGLAMCWPPSGRPRPAPWPASRWTAPRP
jgi:hypothetical protein